MKRILSLIFVFSVFLCPITEAEVTAVNIVTSFGKELESLCNTRDINNRINIENLCQHPIHRMRVIDDLIINLSEGDRHNTLNELGNVGLDTYLNEIWTFGERGNQIRIDNILYDDELSKINVITPNAQCVRYDIHINPDSINPKKYTNLAVVRDNYITSIYQYANVRDFNRALTMLFPDITDFRDLYKERTDVELIEENTDEAFKILRNIVKQNPIGHISDYSRELIASMLIGNVGCNDIHSEQKNYELASYFTAETKCPKIFFDKEHKGWQTGTYYIGDSLTQENGESGKYIKCHPYMNAKGSTYYHAILPYYRPLSFDKPYVFRDKDKFGFKIGNKNFIPAQYKFVYPFDNQVGLAMVQNDTNKWGAINDNGELVIPFKYDVVNDIFINGKNFAIQDNHLILIDTLGNELRKISGYNYLIPKLSENEILAYNYITKSYDAYDFEGNLISDDYFPSKQISKLEDDIPYRVFETLNHQKEDRDYFAFRFSRLHYYKIDDVNKEYLFSIWQTF